MGGAILAANLYLFINDSTIEGNNTISSTGWGGAIFSEGHVTATNSIFRDNYTTGNSAVGGAIFARGDVTLNDSIVTNNRTTGASANAGGLRSNGKVVLMRSTVSGNWTEGDDAPGGGIDAVGDIIVMKSTVSGNYTLGDGSPGGGMFTFHGVDISQSTISGNSTAEINADGGGIRVSRQVLITESTITGNRAERSGVGAGVHQRNYANNFPVTISGTIIAGNLAGGFDADLLTDPQSAKTIDYSLLGTTFGSGVTAGTGTGNLLNVNPELGPLADNGGPTKTHALLPGSPAIDRGDPTFSAPSDFDQRGMPFARVFDGDGTGVARIDMGAYELQPIPPAVVGDFNQDGVVGAADYVVWRATLGDSVASFTGADGNGSGVIDMGDYNIWKSHFGNTYPSMPEMEPASGDLASPAANDFAAFAVYESPTTKPLIRRAPRAPAAEIPVDQHASLLLMRRHADAVDDPEQAGAAMSSRETASQSSPRTLESLVITVFDDWP